MRSEGGGMIDSHADGEGPNAQRSQQQAAKPWTDSMHSRQNRSHFTELKDREEEYEKYTIQEDLPTVGYSCKDPSWCSVRA